MEDYKGIYYKKDNNKSENKQIYYEGGAHFSYLKLYQKLEEIRKRTKKIKLKTTKETEEMKRKKDLQRKKQINQIPKNINNNIINVSIFKII